MAEKTEIAWCDSTHNEWVGCQKVSAGCDNCFAEALMDTRYHRVEWGQRKMLGVAPSVGTRSLTSLANRRKPHSWQRRAAAFRAEHGRRQRVFCSSLSDIFDNQVPDEWRVGLWETIRATPDLDWLLLTKRPENIEKMLPVSWHDDFDLWQHVWLGTTCEDQAAYDKRWPILRDIPARVRFISYEPAIGPLDIRAGHDVFPEWLICGGESGPKARDMPEDWADAVRFDCGVVGTAFFMKQMSRLAPIPHRLMVREFPVAA
jgi:protein gp37